MAKSITMEQLATEVLKQLRGAGHVALFAGGCVRDRMLDVEPKDFDVATSALPQQVQNLFGHKRTIAIGKNFGVITVLGPKPNQVDVATFRSDGEYTDGRHPNKVTYSSPEEDALRRDFTINGMFFDPIAGEVIDYVGGQTDLRKKLIRAIGSPQARIQEDRLRMLRAVRFAATYSFEIESNTLTAIQEQHEYIVDVSQERITHELQQMLCHHSRRTALELLCKSRLGSKVLPDLAAIASNKSRWDRLKCIANRLGADTAVDVSIVFAALFGVEGAGLSIKDVTARCRQLKLSNDERNTVEWLSKHYETLRLADQLKFSELQPLLIHEDIESALTLLDAVARVDGTSTSHVEHCRNKLALPGEQLNPKPLIRGEDLAGEGFNPGPDFAKMLKQARDAQLDGEVDTKEAALKLVAAARSS